MKQINYSIVSLETTESKYDSLIKALELNPNSLVQIKGYDARKQRLNLLQWLRRHNVKELYYTKIKDGILYLGRKE